MQYKPESPRLTTPFVKHAWLPSRKKCATAPSAFNIEDFVRETGLGFKLLKQTRWNDHFDSKKTKHFLQDFQLSKICQGSLAKLYHKNTEIMAILLIISPRNDPMRAPGIGWWKPEGSNVVFKRYLQWLLLRCGTKTIMDYFWAFRLTGEMIRMKV